MTIRDDLWVRLTSGTTALTALIGTRVYRDLLPQNPTYPCIAYRRVSAVRLYDVTGPIAQATPRFEVACFSNDASEVEDVAEAVRANLNGWSSTTGTVTVHNTELVSESDLYDPVIEAHQISIDIALFHNE